jgi:hypothetical protein
MISAQRLGLAPLHLRSDDKLHLALALSVVLHLLVGSLLPGLRLDSRAQGDSALQITFRRASPPGIEVERGATRRDESAAERLAMLSAQSPVPLRSTVAAVVPRMARELPPTLPAAAAPSMRPDEVEAAKPVPQWVGKPGEIQVVLLINENSRAEQILWGKLPALNDRQLQRIEAHLRSRLYPGRRGQTIAEIVDVLAFLRADAKDASPPSNQ